MGITIENDIKILQSRKEEALEEGYKGFANALENAIEIMRKYQQIEQIFKTWYEVGHDGDISAFRDLRKVMKMGMTIEQAEKLLDDLATQEELLCKIADDASGYTRSGNESIRTSNAKTHEQHAKEYRQILRYLAEYRLMQADYEARLKADMIAMLEEIKDSIYTERWDLDRELDIQLSEEVVDLRVIEKIIQQKINSLKESKDSR